MIKGYGDHQLEILDKLQQEGTMSANERERYQVPQDKWQNKLNNFKTGQLGDYIWPQQGKTNVRLLLSPEREAENFYQPVLRLFKDRSRTQYMVPCLVFDGTAWTDEIKYLTVAQTVMQGILAILAGGEYDLLSPIAYGVQIVRSGEGLNTTYNVFPSKNEIPVDYSKYVFERTLEDMAQELEMADRNGEKIPPNIWEDVEEIPF